MNLARSIEETMSYAKEFGVQLTFDELKQRLISKDVYLDKEIKEGLSKNRLKNSLVKSNNNYWLITKTKKAKNLADIIGQKFKDILFIGLTGSVAAGYPAKNDDIDLLIITKKDTLWIVRLLLRWYIFSHHLPHRRYGQQEKRDQFCFNFWLDENALKLPKDKHNLKNAIDLVLMKPLINKDNIYKKFIEENGWAKKYTATGYNEILCLLATQIPPNPPLKKGGAEILYILNFLVFTPQFLFMWPKIGSEKVDLKRAFFHKD
ncbi:MAG: nucleotidyltransferase domain-containing protein [Candidatus Shapirobacteria bacterium]|nr:nucleotidyltransferase domain-containing protein [Candidatus Shapirobacteria bacterium]